MLNTICLLYECFVNKKDWAYFVLHKKYETVQPPDEIGKALKIVSERVSNYNAEEKSVGCGENYNNIINILNKQNIDWNGILRDSEVYQNKSKEISALQKKIKYCKNYMEKKKLEQELNVLYKNRRRKR